MFFDMWVYSLLLQHVSVWNASLAHALALCHALFFSLRWERSNAQVRQEWRWTNHWRRGQGGSLDRYKLSFHGMLLFSVGQTWTSFPYFGFPKVIALSASANQLLKLRDQAEEYAALIMEELDPHNLGYIEVWCSPYILFGMLSHAHSNPHHASATICSFGNLRLCCKVKTASDSDKTLGVTAAKPWARHCRRSEGISSIGCRWQ
jgi:hypothetical protein